MANLRVGGHIFTLTNSIKCGNYRKPTGLRVLLVVPERSGQSKPAPNPENSENNVFSEFSEFMCIALPLYQFQKSRQHVGFGIFGIHDVPNANYGNSSRRRLSGPFWNNFIGRAFSPHTCPSTRCCGSLHRTTTGPTTVGQRVTKFAAPRVTLPRPNNLTVAKRPDLTGAPKRSKQPRPSRHRPSTPSGARPKEPLESRAAASLARCWPRPGDSALARTQLHKRL